MGSHPLEEHPIELPRFCPFDPDVAGGDGLNRCRRCAADLFNVPIINAHRNGGSYNDSQKQEALGTRGGQPLTYLRKALRSPANCWPRVKAPGGCGGRARGQQRPGRESAETRPCYLLLANCRLVSHHERRER